MFKGFYNAASGMISQQRRQEMVTNNVANANTPGYKADRGAFRAFPEMLISRMGTTNLPNNRKIGNHKVLGSLNTGTYMQETIPNFRMSSIQETNNQTDLALITPDNLGAIFFTVQDEEGQARYTRNGAFTLDQNGFLTTSDGYYVVDTGGNPIQILGNEFTVTENGTVIENGMEIAQLQISYAEDPNNLIRVGNGLFALANDEELPFADGVGYIVKQGFIENSNVDVQKAMTDMMMAYRNFEANQQVLKAYDQSMDKAVNEIGRIG